MKTLLPEVPIIQGVQFRSYICEVTPELAQTILDQYPYEGDRPTVEEHTQTLTGEILRGDFTLGSVDICHVPGEIPRRTNGKHTLLSIVRARKAVPCCIREIYCSDLSQVKQQYRCTDIGRRRTPNNLIASWDLPTEGLMPYQIRASRAAAGLLLGGLNGHCRGETYIPGEFRSDSCRRALVSEWASYFRSYYSYMENMGSQLRAQLMSTGILAVGVITTRYQPGEAEVFWRKVCQQDGLRAGDPAQTVVSKVANVRGLSPGQYARMTAKCWNMHLADEDIKAVDRPKADELMKTAIWIAGTPWDGEKIRYCVPGDQIIAKELRPFLEGIEETRVQRKLRAKLFRKHGDGRWLTTPKSPQE